jgi:acetyl-CoA carboxylase carboxyltransferase component
MSGDFAHNSVEVAARALKGNLHKEAAKLEKQGKLFVRERISLLVDEGSFVEDGLLANALAPSDDLPADGVVTGTAMVGGREVVVVANDPTVKAGSWGARTVEKIIRATECALSNTLPVFWLIDSAGARITDQVELFPGRRGAGRIFYNEVQLSGMVPQICCLFGPSAAGGAYIPAFCDIVIMVEGNASMYLGSPRMVEMVTGEITTLEEMGGAKMHTTVSGCGDFLVKTDAEAIETAKKYFAYLPSTWNSPVPTEPSIEPAKVFTRSIVPEAERQAYDMHKVVDAIVDAGSFLEIKKGFAKELITGFGRLDGQTVGVLANNPMQKGGVLFIDSADKAARFIWCCDAFGIPLLFLSDVPGFMVGTVVEKQGIIRHGAKMITAVSQATVPKICVVVRKAYGAGLYAMCGPAFGPEATIALPMAKIAVMGPEPAVNAVYANKIAEIADLGEREAFVAARRAEYEADVDLLRLASEMVIDAVIEPEALRGELITRFARAKNKVRPVVNKRHAVYPV